MRKTVHAVRQPFQDTERAPKSSRRARASAAFSFRSCDGHDPLGPDTSTWEIKDFLTFRINLLYRLLDRQLKKILAKHHDLSIAEWRVLGQLAIYSPTTVRGIAGRTYMAKSQISRAAASLVRTGYALRSKDSDDERSAVFAITKRGKKKYQSVMRMNRERQRRLIAQLDPNERRVMFKATERLIDYVRGDI